MKHGRIPFGVLSIFIVLLLNLLAASPSLHERLHADAGQSGHQCAVSVFAHGKVDSATMEVVAGLLTASFEFLPQACVSVFSTSVDILLPGRGPPVSSSNS